MAAAPGGVISVANPLVPMFDVMIGVRECDPIQRQIGRNRVDDLPAFEKPGSIASSGNDFGPVAKLRRVCLGELLDQSANPVVDALENGVPRALADGALRD